jgi:hypothetical protein
VKKTDLIESGNRIIQSRDKNDLPNKHISISKLQSIMERKKKVKASTVHTPFRAAS